eukprot:gb/GFBE01017418.1/.p1 GENE.gb/GFBE01017418.1/~~gb/GFBE01017418.1/.p1  ORF type:complete len:235 (+),score=48.80 gb/GFBE01017418.1/:1-705(+)
MSATPVLDEDEFKDRDAMGLQPATDKTPSEAVETKKYVKMLLIVIPLIGQVLAWTLYFCCAELFGQKEIYDKKFAFLSEFQLGYVYLCVWILAITRASVVVNANGCRAPARVDRPDQHVYKVMAATGSLKDAPYVMMANTGPQGRFNRAQRGVFNMDESLPLLLTNTVLAAGVFGPVVALLCLLVAYGRVSFALKYKHDVKGRVAGFMPAMIGEKWIEGLLLLCAIKSIFYGSI